MSLISNTEIKKFTDKIAIIHGDMLAILGSTPSAPVAGTIQNQLSNMLLLIAAVNDIEQQIDLGSAIIGGAALANTKNMLAPLRSIVSVINGHCANRGAEVDASIKNLLTYLAFYNATPYTCLLHPSFGHAYQEQTSTTIPPSGLFHYAISPLTDVVSYPHGFAELAWNTTFTAGADAQTTKYSAPVPLLEVAIDFVGGAAPASFVVHGTDDTGATTTTWTHAMAANNPASAISTTFNGAQVADVYGSILVASSTGFVVGQTVELGAGTVNQEFATVIAIADGTHLTLELRKPHASGETISGKTTFALTPSVGGRRIVHVSGITPTWDAGHSAGTVRVVGSQERFGNPSGS